jgi:hypothetical protein
MHRSQALAAFLLLAILPPADARAQAVPATDASLEVRVAERLPAPVAERILVHVAAARERGLPAEPVADRAFELAARGAPAVMIEAGAAGALERLAAARAALAGGGRAGASASELAAGAEALAGGADSAALASLAATAPRGRGLGASLVALAELPGRRMAAADALVLPGGAQPPVRGLVARLAVGARAWTVPTNGGQRGIPGPGRP